MTRIITCQGRTSRPASCSGLLGLRITVHAHAATLGLQERLARALMQYQHPSAAMSRSMLAALRAGPDKEGPASLAARVHRWREALRSAYTALRHGHCPVLYVVGQVSGTRACVAATGSCVWASCLAALVTSKQWR